MDTIYHYSLGWTGTLRDETKTAAKTLGIPLASYLPMAVQEMNKRILSNEMEEEEESG